MAVECIDAFQDLLVEASFAGDDAARDGALESAVHELWDFAFTVMRLADDDLWGPARALLRGLRERWDWLGALHADAKFARDVKKASDAWAAGGAPPRGGFKQADRIWQQHQINAGTKTFDQQREQASDAMYRAYASTDHPTLFSTQWARIAARDPNGVVAQNFAWEVGVSVAYALLTAAAVAVERGNTGPATGAALEVNGRVLEALLQHDDA